MDGSSAARAARTEMALMSGSSLSPRLCTPARLPASRHTLAHGLANSIVAQRAGLRPRRGRGDWVVGAEGGADGGAGKVGAKNGLARASAIEVAERAAKKRREKCGRRSSVAMADDACDEWPFHAGSRGPATGALRPADGALDVDNMEHFGRRSTIPTYTDTITYTHNYTHTITPTRPQYTLNNLPRPSPPTMADDSKMQIMRQVQQEAAMQNARMLVEVRLPPSSSPSSLPSPPPPPHPPTNPPRNSTSTVSSAASPSPAPRCPAAKRAVSKPAWRSTWARGTRSASSMWRGSSASRLRAGWRCDAIGMRWSGRWEK